MADVGKLQALRDACAKDAGLRHRLEQSPDEVLREHGIALGEGVTFAAMAKAILGGALTEAELNAMAGGIEVSSFQWG